MNIPDRAEIDRRIGWHINCLSQFLMEVREEADVRATVLQLTLVVDGARVTKMMDVRVGPNLPGIAEIETELGLRRQGGSEGREASE